MKRSDPDNVQRRRFLGQAAATLGASLFSPVLPAFAAKEELRLGYLPITDAAPLLIAHSLGFFLEEGLVVPRPVMVRSWKVLTESFMAGKFDLTHMLFPIPVWMRFRQKMPVKVLGWDHTNGSAMTVRGDSDIRGFADLGGKQIAVPSWYSTHNLVLQIGLRARGLTPVIKPQNSPLKPNEVNLFILPPSEMPPALLGRKIDGFIVAEPFNALAEMKVRARIMRFTGDVWKNHPCCVLVAREELTRRRPAFVQKAVNAVVRAQLWCEQNREQAAHILSRDGEGYLPVKANVLKRVFTGYDFKEYTTGPPPRAIMHPEWDIQRIGFQPYPFPSATRFVLEQMGKTLVEGDNSFLKNIDSARAAGELVDDSFVLKAMDSNREYGRFFPSDVAQPLSREEIIEID
jgi:NitT/TauT family transport system substrate-binding protein